MQTKPKYKVCRRLGPGVYDKCQTDKFALAMERKSAIRVRGKRPRRTSDYGKQLLEKQKVRFTYGVTEKQFRNYVKSAVDSRDNPVEKLYEMLESRLDNVVYRVGLAPSRRAARQLVVHGHINVNGKRMGIPSHSVSKGDKVAVRDASIEKPVFASIQEKLKEATYPAWLTLDPSKYLVGIKEAPIREDGSDTFDFNSVIEFYSR